MEPLLAAYLASYVSGVQVFPEVHATLAALRAHGVRIGIATNGPPDVVEAVLQHCAVRQCIHCVVTPTYVGAVKPSQAFATFVVAQTGVDPRQIVFVGDRAEDILTARLMGATAVLVDRGIYTPLEVTPDYRVQTLSDILPFCLSTASCTTVTGQTDKGVQATVAPLRSTAAPDAWRWMQEDETQNRELQMGR